MTGRILSKSFPPELKGRGMENQLTIIGKRIGTVVAYLPSTQVYKVKFQDEQTPLENLYRFDQLFSLVIQYRIALAKPKRNGNILTTHMLDYIPVKRSQWAQCIKHREIDNTKQIQFEIKTIQTVNGEVKIGKIIPSGQRMFTSEDVNEIIDEVIDLCRQFGYEQEIPEAIVSMKALKAQYISV